MPMLFHMLLVETTFAATFHHLLAQKVYNKVPGNPIT